MEALYLHHFILCPKTAASKEACFQISKMMGSSVSPRHLKFQSMYGFSDTLHGTQNVGNPCSVKRNEMLQKLS
jgi:hypothetical protein